MNEEALKDAYKLFGDNGYNGSLDEFKSLISTNNEALTDAFNLFTENGYTGSVDEFKGLVINENNNKEISEDTTVVTEPEKPEVTASLAFEDFDGKEETQAVAMLSALPEYSQYEFSESTPNRDVITVTHKDSGKEQDFMLNSQWNRDRNINVDGQAVYDDLISFLNTNKTAEKPVEKEEEEELIAEVVPLGEEPPKKEKKVEEEIIPLEEQDLTENQKEIKVFTDQLFDVVNAKFSDKQKDAALVIAEAGDYNDFLSQASQVLQAENKQLPPEDQTPINSKTIKEKAIELSVLNQEDKWQQAKADEILENFETAKGINRTESLESMLGTVWQNSGARGLNTVMNIKNWYEKVAKDDFTTAEREQIAKDPWGFAARVAMADLGGTQSQEYLKNRQELYSQLRVKQKTLEKEYASKVNNILARKKDLEFNVQALTKYEKRITTKDPTFTKKDYDEYLKLREKLIEQQEVFNQDLENLGKNPIPTNDVETIKNLTLKTYDNLQMVDNNIASSIMNLVGGVAYVKHKFQIPELLKWVDIDISKQEDLDNIFGKEDSTIKDLAKKVGTNHENIGSLLNTTMEMGSALKNLNAPVPSIGEVKSVEDFGMYIMDLGSGQVVNTALTIAYPPAGLILLSAQASGQKMHEMDKEIAGIKGSDGEWIVPPKDINALQYFSTAALYGGVEYATERVSLGVLKGGFKNVKKAFELTGKAGPNLTLKNLTTPQMWAKTGYDIGSGSTKEAFAEGLVGVGNNFADHYFLGNKEVSLLDGVTDNMAAGFFMGNMHSAPHLVAAVTQSFSSEGELAQANKINEQIRRLSQERNELLDLKGPSTTTEKIQTQINSLLDKQMEAMNLVQQRTLDMTSADRQGMIDQYNHEHKLRYEIDEINADPDLAPETKAELININAQEIAESEAKRERIIANATFNKDIKRSRDLANKIRIENGTLGDVQTVVAENADNALQQGLDNIDAREDLTDQQKSALKKNLETEFNDMKKKSSDGETYHGFAWGDNIEIETQKDGKMVKETVNVPMTFALNKGNMTVQSHELGHQTLFKQFMSGNPDAVGLVDDLEAYVQKNYKQAYERFNKVRGAYKTEGLTKEQIAEEQLAHLSDFMRQNNLKGDRTLYNKLFGRFQKVNDGSNEISTGKDVFDMLNSYNQSFETGNLQGLAKSVIKGEAVVKRQAQKARDNRSQEQIADIQANLKQKGVKPSKFIEGETTQERSKRQTKRNVDVDKVYEQDAVGKDNEGWRDFLDSPKGQKVMGDLVNQYYPDMVATAIKRKAESPTDAASEALIPLMQHIQAFDPSKNKNLPGYIGGYLGLKVGTGVKKAAKKAPTISMEKEGVREVAEKQAVKEETREEAPVREGIKLAERLGDDAKKISEKVKKMKPVLEGKTYKTLKDLTPDDTQRMFGIKPKPGNLTKQDVKNAQQFINKNADILLAMLPEGTTVGGKATGVQKVLLDAFYTKGRRVKAAKTGSKAGLATQTKKPDIKISEFKEVFGITPAGQLNVIDRNTSARIKALVEQTGRLITNQAVREVTPDAPKDIAEGKSKVMFAKDLNAFIQKQNFSGKVLPGDFATENKSWNNLLDKALEGSGITKINMRTPEGRKRFLDFAVNSGLTQKLPKSFWRSMQGTSIGIDKLVTNKADRALIKELKKEGYKTVEIDPARGHTGNLPFINVAEADAWINSVEKEGGKFAKESDVFTDMLKKEDPLSKKLPLEKALNDPAFIKRQENSIKGLKKVFEALEDAMKNPEGIAFAGALMSSTSYSQNHFIRKAAPWKFYEKGFAKGNYTQEHTLPASIVGKYLFGQALAGTVNENFDKIKNNYFQGALLNTSDAKLKGTKPNGDLFNYVEQTPEGWTLDDNIWARYFNENVETNNGGIDPNSLMLAGNKSVAQEFNVDVKGVKVSPDLIQAQNEIITDQVKGEITKAYSKKLIDTAIPVIQLKAKQATPANETMINSTGVMKSKDLNNEETIRQTEILDQALNIARDPNAPVKKIRVFDFDDTLARTKSNVLYTMPDGKTGKITPAEYAAKGTEMLEQGAEFDFSEFNKVMDGRKGPMFKVAETIAEKRGTSDMFVLTARSAEAAPAIKEFLDALGLNIPIENITGLGDSSPLAKSGWMVGKAAEGYNDFYFADDHLGNVRAVEKVMSLVDVKSKVQQAKVKFSKDVDQIFNDIIENKTGILSEKEYSAAKAKTVGAKKGKWKFWIAPSAEDFVGLLYPLLGKGKLGDTQMAWFKEHLLDPYGRAMENLSRRQNRLSNDFKALKKALVKGGSIPKNLNKKAFDKWTYQDVARVAAWHTQGFDIPGLSKADLNEMLDFIQQNPGIKTFADQLIMINKGDGYAKPGKDWLAGTISTDLLDGLRTDGRSEYLQEWKANKDLIFSEKNLNKLEATYGPKYREALEDMLRRMETGKNRTSTGSRLENQLLDYINNSVGTVMFLNMRSGVLQTLSAVNFLNWSDNNPLKAGAAFANQPRYWKDFMRLMNSDFLIDRRNGLKINVSESEIADAARTSKNKAKAVISYLLQKGFTVTQIMDSFAIASGGATFYRNRIKKYVKQGMTQADAEAKAYLDFREVAEESQQSARPDRISQQQASALGRVILAFANTPMQYNRIMKKAFLDLKNGRGDAKTHISKMIYYGAIQNLMFTAMQQAMFAMLFDDEEEPDEVKRKKYMRIGNSMMDNILRGLGIWGTAASTLIAITKKAIEESQKEGYPGPDYDAAAMELLNFSPPIDIKISKLRQAGSNWKYEGWKHDEAAWSMKDPAYKSAAYVISSLTNIPIDRFYKKMDNIQSALDSNNEAWKRVANILGWANWELESDAERKERIADEKVRKKKVKKEKIKKEEEKKIATMSEADKKKLAKEKEYKKYKDLNKAEQVNKLDSLGLSKSEIRGLKYEKDRVEKLIELMNK